MNEAIINSLDSSSNRYQTEAVSRYVLVSPAIAESLLTLNKDNRRIRKSAVDYCCRLINNEEWKLTHQGVAISNEDILIDGQHRLHAIIKTGKTVPLQVTTNLPPEAFKAMDLGLKRSASDITGLTNEEAAIARFLAKIYLSANPTMGEIEDIGYQLKAKVEAINTYSAAATKYTSQAPIKAAAAIRIIQNENNLEYIGSTYATINQRLMYNFTKIMSSFYHQIIENKNSQEQLFARAMILFDESKKSNTRVSITKETQRHIYLETKETLRLFLWP